MNKKRKTTKRYKCPYCEFRAERDELVSHIDEIHEDLIPDNHTASRVVFNSVNKKTHGNCTQCGKETKWNETSCRYERLCNNKKCYDAYVALMKGRMQNKYGKTHLLNDPEKQKEMLSGRRISGEYKFTDGGIRSYCGSYERKLLEFYDKVLNVPSKDIVTPGPIIEYEFEGSTLKWITDIYYIPYNLVHDVKDGGSNPNKREMPIYREKQIAKEKAIAKQGEFNYIRLTDNDFSQLIEILLEMKNNIIEDIKTPTIRINEHQDILLVPYYKYDSLVGIALAENTDLRKLYVIEDGVIVEKTGVFLSEYNYDIYRPKDSVSIDRILNATDLDMDYFYEASTGKQLYDKSQIEIDGVCERVLDVYEECYIVNRILESSMENIFSENPIIYEQCSSEDLKILKNYNNLTTLSTIGGVIVYNEISKKSSPVVPNVKCIYDDYLKVLDKI